MPLTSSNLSYNDFLSDFDFSTGTLEEFIRAYKRNNLPNNTKDFFLKSFMIFFLKFDSYIPDLNFRNGLLHHTSGNCKFTIANIKREPSFIKVVDSHSSNDLLLYDIVSGYILNKIISSELSRFKSCVTEYKYSFSSYYYSNTWNYNDLILYDDAHNQYKHRYNYNNIKYNESKYIPCHIYISNVVKGNAISYGQLFLYYIENLDMQNFRNIITILASMEIVYDFLELSGTKYGYIHNDLHSGNILFDDVDNRLVIIDYGRNVFQYFSDNQDDDLNTFIKNEVYKLDLNSKFNNDLDLNYKKIIESTNFGIEVPSYKVNNIYLGITFDIITLSLNLYKFLYFLKEVTGNNELENIIDIFETLIKFDGDVNTYTHKILVNDIQLDRLILTYETKRLELESGGVVSLQSLKNIYLYIYDGLLLLALLFINRNINEIDLSLRNSIIYGAGFQIRTLDTREINSYLTFVKETFDTNHVKLNKCIILRKLGSSSGGSLGSKSTTKILKTYIKGKAILNMEKKSSKTYLNNDLKFITNNKKTISDMKRKSSKTHLYNPVEFITNIKKEIGYKQLTKPISVGQNYINIYNYITKNKLSINYAQK